MPSKTAHHRAATAKNRAKVDPKRKQRAIMVRIAVEILLETFILTLTLPLTPSLG